MVKFEKIKFLNTKDKCIDIFKSASLDDGTKLQAEKSYFQFAQYKMKKNSLQKEIVKIKLILDFKMVSGYIYLILI